jgi:hypothetical protein
MSGGVTERLVDIARLKIWVGPQNLLARFSRGQKAKQARDRKPHPSDAGLPGTDSRIDRDAGKRHVQHYA